MDVIVIGAGPVGSFTALKLAQAGLRVLVLEEHATVGQPAHCTGVISRHVFERFQLPRESIISELSGATLYSPAGHSLTLDLNDDAAPRRARQVCVIDRPAFDRRVGGLALEAGASYWLGARAQGLEINHRGLSLTVTAEERTHRLRARMCIIAGGSRCRLGADLGLSYPSHYANGAQVEAAVRDAGGVEVYCGRSVAPGSFGWVVPLGGGMARVGVRAFGEVHRRLQRLFEHPRLRGRVSAPAGRTIGGPIPAAASPKTYAERLLTVGDAAGQVKTTTGGGVLFGLVGAEIAAQVALEACRRDRFDEGFLRLYQQRWRGAISGELRLGLIARRLIGLLRDEDLDELFRRAQGSALARRLAQTTDFDHHARQLLAVLRGPALLAVLKGALP